MKHFIHLSIFVLLNFSGYGQSVSDMLAATRQANPDSVRLASYVQLVKHYRFSNQDSARLLAAKGLSLARSKADLRGEARLLTALADVNEHLGDLDVAEEQYSEACRIFISAGDSLGLAQATNGLGVVSGKTGRYRDAMRHFLDALRLFEKVNNQRGIMLTYIKLGLVNDHLGDLDLALTYYLKAEQLNEHLGNAHANATLLNNIGIVYGKREELRTALRYFQAGLRMTDPANPSEVRIDLLSSLGIAYDKLGMKDSAWYYQQQSLSQARENNLPEPEARALLNLAELVKTTDPVQSLELLDRALEISRSIKQLSLQSEVYEAMVLVYKADGNFQKALALTEERQLLRDSLFSLQKAKEIAGLVATQELARQESELKSLAMRNEKSILQRNVMIGISLLALAVIAIVWHYNRRVSRLNSELVRNQGELRESNELKDKLFSILGHDLRSPLARVIGLLNILSMHNGSPQEREIIGKVRQQASMTLETLDTLLTWGKRQIQGIRLHQQAVNAREQIQNSLLLNEDYAQQKEVVIVNDIPHDLVVHVDPGHFDFVMRNLLSNAIKFSHSGGTITITASSVSDEHTVFAIRDSGVGIPDQVRKKIFSAGAKSAPGTWNEKGTGIGLMLCREYIIQNGGLLWAESQEGKGSTFYFTLRQQVSEAQPVQ